MRPHNNTGSVESSFGVLVGGCWGIVYFNSISCLPNSVAVNMLGLGPETFVWSHWFAASEEWVSVAVELFKGDHSSISEKKVQHCHCKWWTDKWIVVRRVRPTRFFIVICMLLLACCIWFLLFHCWGDRRNRWPLPSSFCSSDNFCGFKNKKRMSRFCKL